MSPTDEAVGRYSAAIGRVAACITAERHRVRPYISLSGRAYLYSLPLPVGLRANDGSRSGLRFTFQEVIQFGQGQSIPGSGSRGELRMYEYRLLDHVDRELLVYHWHPDAAGPDHPHLHVSASLDAQVDALTRREIALDKRHLATGLVSLSAVVSMLITEFGVRPLRSDWQHRLADPATH